MRPPSRRLAPQSQNHQAAPPRPSGGGVRGPGDPPLSPPPQPKAGRRPARETAAPHPPVGAAAPGGGTPQPRHAQPRAKHPRWTARTLPHYPLPTDNVTGAPRNDAAHSEAGLEKAGARTGERRSPPPPRHTDPLAADRATPGAHGGPANQTARVYPRGARRRQRVTGGRGAAARPPLPPPLPPLLPHPASRGGAGPPPPRGRGDIPSPPEGTATPGRARSWTGTPRAPAPPTACSHRGRDWRAGPLQRARATHGPRPRAARDDEPEQYGGRAFPDQSIAKDTRNVARSGRAG